MRAVTLLVGHRHSTHLSFGLPLLGIELIIYACWQHGRRQLPVPGVWEAVRTTLQVTGMHSYYEKPAVIENMTDFFVVDTY